MQLRDCLSKKVQFTANCYRLNNIFVPVVRHVLMGDATDLSF